VRIANLRGRAVLLHPADGGAVDIATASGGRFGPDPMEIYAQWSEFGAWAAAATLPAGSPFDEGDLDAPVPSPGQVFAIGLNYRDHAAEANLPTPDHLIVFTKFASSLGAPHETVTLPSDKVDYETELVAVIGREAHHVSPEEAWDAVAGVCIGQDYSERAVQLRGPAPQFSLGKSYPGFGPFGPAIVTVDELADRDRLGVRATLTRDGADEVLQDGTTADMVFGVAEIVSELSQVVTLRPGDVIFTGTPAGVGGTRGFFLRPGDALTSELVGVGSITNRFVA
jgi:2-keto-4-pentenoate hydratase/2-oxohepta-3-ene-1,7-dioic acid hydratase in catechol pathway